MATPGQWVPPLPPGWEARWDPNQRAYFFIDHVHKQTSWVDPRFAPATHQQPQQHHHHAAAQSLNPQSLHATGGQNVAMTTMMKQFGSTTSRDSGSSDDDEWENPEDFDKLFASSSDVKKVDMVKLQEIKSSFPSAPEHLIKSLLEKHSNSVVKTTNDLFNSGYKREAVSHPPPRRVDMLERLKAMFPTATTELVEDMLGSCNNDEKKAREQLESMGYATNFPATHRNASAQRSRKTSPSPARTPHRGTSPAKHSASPAKRSTSPAKPKLSESEKQSLVRKLQNQFMSAEKSVVEMALQVCEYDEARAKNVLERMNTADDGSSPPQSRPSTARTRSPSPTPIGPSSLEPLTLFDDRPSTSSSTREGGQSRGSTPGVKKSSDSASRPSTGKSTSKTPSPKSRTTTTTSQQHRAKQVTQMSKDVLSSTIATLSRITNNVNCCRQPELPQETETSNQNAADTSKSEDSTQAHDESSANDSSRGQGQSVVSRQPQPRQTYTSQYRTEAKGADPSLRVGPNKDLLLSEYTCAKGPNPELRQGPDPSRVQGSQGATGPDRSCHCGPNFTLRNGPGSENLLVTAI